MPDEWMREHVKEINVLKVEPGDVVVLKLDCYAISDANMKHVSENVKRLLPEGTKVMILTQDQDIKVLKAGDVE